MELPLRHLTVQRESGRSSEAQIRQEGSRFGATHVTGGSVFQGNFVGLTVSKYILTLLAPLYILKAYNTQTP